MVDLYRCVHQRPFSALVEERGAICGILASHLAQPLNKRLDRRLDSLCYRFPMPSKDVPSKFKAGLLRSGGPRGPVVRKRAQMLAILMSEKRKEQQGKKP